MKKYLTVYPWYCVYAPGDPPIGDPPVGDPSTDDPPVGDPPLDQSGKKTFTQEDVNKIVTEDRKKLQAQVNKTVKELEDLKRSKTLSEKEKTGLQGRIDELQNSLLTKEQLAAKDREKLETTHKQTVQSLTTERDTWHNRFVKAQIEQAITSEANKHEAFDAADIIDKLWPSTRLAEDTDEDGKGTGIFFPKVKFNDLDQEGKSVTLDFTVEQAVKRMKEMPKFSHLFKSTAVGGIGENAGAGKGRKKEIKDMSTEEYMKYRKEQGFHRKGYGQ